MSLSIDTYQYDALTVLSDGGTAYTSNQISKVAAANKILDLGGAVNRTDLGIVGTLARMRGTVVIDVSAIDTTSSNETYLINVLGSNNADGSAPVGLGAIYLGYGGSLPNGTAGAASTGAGSTSFATRYVALVDNYQGLIAYRYLYLFNTIAGTTPAITYRSWQVPQVSFTG